MNTMSGNKVRTILPTSPTAKQLQFICIILEKLGFTMYNFYLNTTVLSRDPAHLSVTMSHTQQEA